MSAGPPPYPAAKSTNGFAIAALVCPLVACGVGSILGIVFGHVARRQIKRTGEGGSGLALAGLIIGYVTLGLAIVAVGAFVTFVRFADNDVGAVATARHLDEQIVAVAELEGSSPRTAAVIRRALRSGCCGVQYASVTLGGSGVDVRGTTDTELERVGWRLQIEDPYRGASGSGVACLTVPTTSARSSRDVVSGRC